MLTAAVRYKSPFRLSGKLLLLRPATLSEILTFEHLFAEGYREQAVKFLIESAVQSGGDFKTRKKALKHTLKYKSYITKLVDQICDISLPEYKNRSEETTKDSGNTNIDYSKTVCRLLAKLYGWTAEQVENMSPKQIHIYLTAGKSGTGVEKMTSAEYQEFKTMRGMN